MATLMPDLAEERRLAKADGRYFTIEQQQVSYAGTAAVHGELDLADALDLEQAVAGLATQLKDLGSTDPWTSAAPQRSGSSPATSSPSPFPTPGWLRRALRARLETTSDAADRSLRPPLPSRPRRRRHRQARERQPADHRRPGPRLVRHGRQRSP